jgi:hypothetical protein
MLLKVASQFLFFFKRVTTTSLLFACIYTTELDRFAFDPIVHSRDCCVMTNTLTTISLMSIGIQTLNPDGSTAQLYTYLWYLQADEDRIYIAVPRYVNLYFNKRTNRIFCFLFICVVYIQEQMSSDVNVHIDIDTHTRVFTYTYR